MQIALLYVSNTPLIVKLCNRFSIGVNDWPLCEIESIFVVFDCPKVQLFFRWCNWMLIHMQIALFESSFTLMKFAEVLVNVYLHYSFNCWRKWLYILREWTAKGVLDADFIFVVGDLVKGGLRNRVAGVHRLHWSSCIKAPELQSHGIQPFSFCSISFLLCNGTVQLKAKLPQQPIRGRCLNCMI